MIQEPINYENAGVYLPSINQSLLILEVMLGTFTQAFFENSKTNDWCQCASVPVCWAIWRYYNSDLHMKDAQIIV